VRTTDSNHDHPIAENLLQQNFDAQGPGQAWVSDITYLPTGQGWLYLACTMDLFSRRIVGWSMAATLHADIAVDALRMAVDRCRPSDGMIHHSDRGSQYASEVFRAELRRHGMTASMSRKADCYDNAAMESFFHSLKVELVYREFWHGHAQARGRVFDYLESFYNRTRLHSRLGYMSPLEYETAHGRSDSVSSQATPR
jgi:transposase InsO family protein